jgi:hypothetical protein
MTLVFEMSRRFSIEIEIVWTDRIQESLQYKSSKTYAIPILPAKQSSFVCVMCNLKFTPNKVNNWFSFVLEQDIIVRKATAEYVSSRRTPAMLLQNFDFLFKSFATAFHLKIVSALCRFSVEDFSEIMGLSLNKS